jgi:multicomponent Na+:H+ antiporter subunit B
VTRGARLLLFGTSGAGLLALLLWAVSGLPDFGHYPGPYGTLLNRVAVGERHATNVVTAVVFDYRGFDTLGEEFILFAAVLGIGLLLRETRERQLTGVTDDVRSEVLGSLGVAAAPPLLVIGLYVLAHGPLTPGGAFQGGVVLAAGFMLLYLGGGYRLYVRVAPKQLVDFAESFGIGAYPAIGIAGLIAGGAFLDNVVGLGTIGKLGSGGTIMLLNLTSGIAVGAAFLLIFSEFVEEVEIERRKSSR